MIQIKCCRLEEAGAVSKGKAGGESFIRIEETQAALRDSIEQAKALASKSDRLIRRHREEKMEDRPPIAAA